MSADSPTHVAFADESSYNIHRYRSLGLVSVTQEKYGDCSCDIQAIATASGVRELKWKNLDSAQMRFAVEKVVNYIVDKAVRSILRVDVLIWDIEDTRHKIDGRDDTANLHRMYYHLFENVLRRRWPAEALWQLHPDENSGLNWQEISSYIDDAGSRLVIDEDCFSPAGFRLKLRQDFSVAEIAPCESHQEPLVQVADLFAGLGSYSHQSYDVYENWLRTSGPQMTLFDEQSDTPHLSRTHRERCYILKHLNSLCKQRKLGVSLKTRRGLTTPNPEKPINFWLYVPQHDNDKAPVRARA